MINRSQSFQVLSGGVRVSDLRAYLTARGWKSAPFARREELKYVVPAEAPPSETVLLLPSTEELDDYAERVELVVNSLSKLEDRPFEQVLRDILTPTCDKVNVRLQTAEVRTGTLLLGFAAQFFDAVRNLLTFAACAEQDPRPYFPRAFKDAAAFAGRCRLAGTAPGSFRVTVEAPLPPPASHMQKQLLAFPKERRILLGLMQGLTDLRAAHDRGSMDAFVSASQHRINANICDALRKMRPDADDAVVDIQVNWSPTWPLPDRSMGASVSFDDRSFETIAALGQALRTGEESTKRPWQGKVVGCAAEDPRLDNGHATMIKLRVEDYAPPMRIEVRLSAEDYRRAVQAHLDGKSVRITGALEKSGKKAALLEPSDFQVLQ